MVSDCLRHGQLKFGGNLRHILNCSKDQILATDSSLCRQDQRGDSRPGYPVERSSTILTLLCHPVVAQFEISEVVADLCALLIRMNRNRSPPITAKRIVHAMAIIHQSNPFVSSLQCAKFHARSRQYAIRSTSAARAPILGFMLLQKTPRPTVPPILQSSKRGY